MAIMDLEDILGVLEAQGHQLPLVFKLHMFLSIIQIVLTSLYFYAIAVVGLRIPIAASACIFPSKCNDCGNNRITTYEKK